MVANGGLKGHKRSSTSIIWAFRHSSSNIQSTAIGGLKDQYLDMFHWWSLRKCLKGDPGWPEVSDPGGAFEGFSLGIHRWCWEPALRWNWANLLSRQGVAAWRAYLEIFGHWKWMKFDGRWWHFGGFKILLLGNHALNIFECRDGPEITTRIWDSEASILMCGKVGEIIIVVLGGLWHFSIASNPFLEYKTHPQIINTSGSFYMFLLLGIIRG